MTGKPFFKELDELYREILQRPVDPSGYRTYSGMLGLDGKSLDDVAKILRCSDEYQRLCSATDRSICYDVPHRSPLAVAEAIQDVIAGRLVCDLGCGEGDNLVSLGRFAGRVVGMETDPLRYRQAVTRGFEVVQGDYWHDPVPPAEVYYFFTTDGSADNEYLVSKLLDDTAFNGTIVIVADSSVAGERMSIRRCSRLGELRAVAYDEGTGERQRGVMLLAIIHAPEARARRKCRRNRERRVIVTLGIGPEMEPLMVTMLPSIEAYADATGSDLCLISLPQIEASSVFYEVFQTARLFNYYDRVLYMDLDIIVRAGAPDLFDIVPTDHVGAFVESRMQSANDVEFFNNPESPTGQSGTQPGLVPDSFNNGVMVMSRQHRHVMEPLAEYPDDALCADQTIMNARIVNSGTPLYDISEAFNYMVCMLDPQDEGLRRSAWMIHYGSLPVAVKLENAARDLAAWRQDTAASVPRRRLNRVFRQLVPVAQARGSNLARGLEGRSASITGYCDGTRSVADIVGLYSEKTGRDTAEVEQEVVSAINALLESGGLSARNQYSRE